MLRILRLANTSMGDLFKAGLIPGIMMGIGIKFVCYIWSCRKGYEGTNNWNGMKSTKPELAALVLVFFLAASSLVIHSGRNTSHLLFYHISNINIRNVVESMLPYS